MLSAFGMNPKDDGSSPLHVETFCLKSFDTFTRTSVHTSKINAVACAQLTVQMLTLVEKYQIWRIHLDRWGHDCKKWIGPTFGYKVWQSDAIVMQLKLDMLCHLLNVYAKFQIDISSMVEVWKCGEYKDLPWYC